MALIINTLIISKSFYIKDVTGIKKLNFIFDMIGDILSLISFIIFSEMVELHFCGLDNIFPKKRRNRTFREFNEFPLDPDPDDELVLHINDIDLLD